MGLPDKKKKKRASTSQGRAVNVSVCRLRKFTSYIPKGHVRNLLRKDGRILNIQFTRSMTSTVVKECIDRAYNQGPWIFLDTGQDNKLVEAENQSPDGNMVCSR